MRDNFVSNLPRDANGKIRGGPGRGNNKNKIPQLARDNIQECFNKLGGVPGLYAWCKKAPKNMYSFYTYIWPKILATEPRMALVDFRPEVTSITSYIVDTRKELLPPELDFERLRNEPVFYYEPEPSREEDEEADADTATAGWVPL